MKFRDNIAVLLLILLISLGIHAQDKAKDKSKDDKTFEVRINLMVLDDKNQHVSGLKESDVKVFENGVEQKLTYFATKDLSLNVCLVVDNSGSVRTQLKQVTTIAKLLVENLRAEDEAQVIRFVGRDNISTEQEWTNKKNAINEALNNLYISGGQTAVIDALYLASDNILKRQKTAPNKRYAIVLISDGEDRDSFYNQKQLLKLVSDTDVQIFTIALVKDLGKGGGDWNQKSPGWVKKMTTRIAAQTGGTSFILDDKVKEADYRTALQSLISELRSQIVIGYTLDDLKKGDRTRKLTVTVADGPNGEKRKVIIKENLVLPSD